MKQHLLILFLLVFSLKNTAQSILLEPAGDGKGIYANRGSFYNFNVPSTLTLPDSGQGTRFMWIPDRSALRVGSVSSTEWNNANISPYSFAIGLDLKVTGLAAGSIGFQNLATGNQSFSGGFNNNAAGNQSLAFGLSNTALGNVSYAIGSSNSISNTGTNSIAIGQSNNVQSTNNYLIGKSNQGKSDLEFAFGFNNTVSASRSFSFGNDNENSGVDSYNFGLANNSKFERSMSIGFNNASEGFQAIGIGVGNSPKGENSIALGAGNRTSNDKSIAIGSFNRTNGKFSVSSGFGLVNNSYGSMVVGLYNDSLVLNNSGKPVQSNSYSSNDPIFVIGNGVDDLNRSNALVVYKNSNVGINTSQPTQKLDVNGSARFRSVVADNNNNVFVTIENDGTIKRTTVNLSDISLKQNIKPLENSLQKVLALSGKMYNFKENPAQPRIGFIAQEVEEIVPEVVFENDEGLKGVRYQEIVALLTEALKEQQGQIESLKQQLSNFQSTSNTTKNIQK